MFYNMKNPNKIYLIAEIGVNHNGSLSLAKELIYEASKSGVDAVKFQTFKADNLLSSDKIEKAPYQKRENSENQYKMLKKLELNYGDFKELKDMCNELKLDFMSTPYDKDSVILLKNLNVDTVKIASADLINKNLIDSILDQDLNMILSVGMATYEEISRTVEYILKRKKKIELGLLHCTTSYPTDYKDVNMNVMKKLIKDYEDRLVIGYSDHTEGNEVALMAVSLGAKIVEKHFTLDKNMEGPDHFASAEPNELKNLVQSIRNLEQAFGKDNKILTENEIININVMRRSVHAKETFDIGHIIKEADITLTRPYDGYSAWEYEKLIGKKLTKHIIKGEPIIWGDLI